MGRDNLKLVLRYYGVSPWEIEVIYGYLNSRFTVIQEEIEPNNEKFVSFLNFDIPLPFNESFFKWFEFKRWEKMKAVFREMKRRRGSGNALMLRINFCGFPNIVFVIDVEDRKLFDIAVEKIDFVLELLPYHLDSKKLPRGIDEIDYRFDPLSARWRLNSAKSKINLYYFRGDKWVEVI